jgi:hypothetical protein
VIDAGLARRYLGACALLIGFAGTFLLLQIFPVPLFWYHPLGGGFALEVRPQGLAMDFYGRTLWASLMGMALFPLGHRLGGRLPLNRDRIWLSLAYGLSLTALAMGLIGYQIWPRPPTPLPIPSGYAP